MDAPDYTTIYSTGPTIRPPMARQRNAYAAAAVTAATLLAAAVIAACAYLYQTTAAADRAATATARATTTAGAAMYTATEATPLAAHTATAGTYNPARDATYRAAGGYGPPTPTDMRKAITAWEAHRAAVDHWAAQPANHTQGGRDTWAQAARTATHAVATYRAARANDG